MGDIIWGTFFILLLLGVFGLYRFFTRKKIEQRSVVKFIAILLITGGSIGILISALNERLLHDDPYTYFLALVFFILQTLASILYYRAMKIGLPLLILTLLLQVPILRGLNYSYRSQTFFSVNLENYPGKFWDIEPGSYVHFIYFEINHEFGHIHIENSTQKSRFGLNIVPLLTMIVLLRKKKQVKES